MFTIAAEAAEGMLPRYGPETLSKIYNLTPRVRVGSDRGDFARRG